MAAELGQQTVEFSALVRRAAEDSYLTLKELVDKSSKSVEERSDSEKKIDLLKFIDKTRQRMLRLLVLSKWCHQVPLVNRCQQITATLSNHETCFTQTADSLFYMHEGLQQARAPMFDVPSAIEVLLTGGYQRLPKCIEDIGTSATLSEDQQKPALKKLDALLRSKLLDVSIPKEISDIKVSDGVAILKVDGEFKIFLTLGYHGHLSMWRILHLELLVGEKCGLLKLEESQRYILGDDLERRMAESENPLMILYTVLHELCIALIMDTVKRQVQALCQGRWTDAIRVEIFYDGNAGLGGNASATQPAQDSELDLTGQKRPGLKITYWFDKRNVGGSDSSLARFIKIEQGQDLQIKCLHDPFVLDPLTDKEAEFSLDQSCIDVEKLVLRAIVCSIHTRLLEIQRDLSKNLLICQTSGDVILKRDGDDIDANLRKKDGKLSVEDHCGDEVLQVRAYGGSYFTLGINIRNGHFLLQSSENILAQSALPDCEEALNKGRKSATEVFLSLRRKSILHLFASSGRFLGLKVFEECLAAFKIPNSVLHGNDLLLMGFPQCGGSYYMLMQLDKDFKPVLNLLEAQPDPDGKSQSISDSNHVIRFNTINLGRMQMIEDELNLRLLDCEKLHSSSNIGACSQISQDGLLSEFGLEAPLQLPGCTRSSFSATVDEVFELEKGASGPYPSQGHLSLSSNFSPTSRSSPPINNHQRLKTGVGSPKWEGGLQYPQIGCIATSAGVSSTSGLPYLSNSIKGLLHINATESLSSSSPVRSSYMQKLPISKSEQDLKSVKSPYSSEVGPFSAFGENSARQVNELPKDASTMSSGIRPAQPPLRANSSWVPGSSTKPDGFKNSSPSHSVGFLRDTRHSSFNGSTICLMPEIKISRTSGSDDVSKHERTAVKRTGSHMQMVPSFQRSTANSRLSKRRKILESAHNNLSEAPSSLSCIAGGYMHGDQPVEVTTDLPPSNLYVSVLLHLIRHCSLCIKHAQLTSQMDALDISYVEELDLRAPFSNLWFGLPFSRDDSWQNICLHLGKPGSMSWDVRINDPHFKELWELQKGSTSTPWGSGVRIANASDSDSHINYDPYGVILSYNSVEVDSIQRLVSDLQRLSSARIFAHGMRKLIGVKSDNKLDDVNTNSDIKLQYPTKGSSDVSDKLSEQMRRNFKIEAVGLMSLWFSYGSMPVMAHFVVEWEAGKEGCTMHVSPDHLWPHTKFLEDFINGAEVAPFLDCIRLTAGPLLALAAAIPPARTPGPVSTGPITVAKQNTSIPSQGQLPNASSPSTMLPTSSANMGTITAASLVNHSLHSATMLSVTGRGGSGIFPSSLLPIDVSVVLRGPYWIRIIYRKKFAVDMRCFSGDQVWLQPATPPKGGPAAGGSLPCPQFRPFIMEHVAQGLNALEPNFPGGTHAGGHMNSNINQSLGTQIQAPNGNRPNVATSSGMSRPTSVGSQVASAVSRANNAVLASSGISGVPVRISPGTVPVQVRGELNTAFIGLGDDGGYGGGWVPLAALKKVLRGILKYLGVLWLFAQLPDLLTEILGSILKENEGALLNLDQEQPALRFFVGGYVFAVSVHRVQLLLQVLSVKRFHHQQPPQQTQTNAQEELAPGEINEICDYFSRRVASEPYDASRVASFITLLTLPISVLREFLKLISWKKGLSQAHGGEIASAQRARVELCLENHSGSVSDEYLEGSATSRSNIHHDRARSSVDFALTFVLDPAHIPHINAAGGAAWLPYCASVRLRYSFGESTHLSFLGMDGSHGGRACWLRLEDWEKCKQRMARTVEYVNGPTAGDVTQGRLRLAAETLQRTLQVSFQHPRDGALPSSSTGA